MKIKVVRTIEVEIESCIHRCPYFELDGGPGPVMACFHPDALAKGMEGSYIISHPEGDVGFPAKCPLLNKEKPQPKPGKTLIEGLKPQPK